MRRTRTTTLKVSGPFSLAAAIDSLEAVNPGMRVAPGVYEGHHTIRGRALSIRVRQAAPRRLVMSVDGDAVEREDVTAAEALVRHIFGLDLDADRFYAEAGRDDRVLRKLQSRLLGVRPVNAPSPIAALVWLIVADEHGLERARLVFGRLGGELRVPPGPGDLAALDGTADSARLGLEPVTVERLRLVGERGLEGTFGAELLRSMPAHAARSWLCVQAEVSPMTADLVLMAGAGRLDVVPAASPQLLAAVGRYYGVARSEARRRLDDLQRRWGEFGAWAAYLLLEAARRDGAPSTA